jgi:hypothetical protein
MAYSQVSYRCPVLEPHRPDVPVVVTEYGQGAAVNPSFDLTLDEGLLTASQLC